MESVLQDFIWEKMFPIPTQLQQNILCGLGPGSTRLRYLINFNFFEHKCKTVPVHVTKPDIKTRNENQGPWSGGAGGRTCHPNIFKIIKN